MLSLVKRVAMSGIRSGKLPYRYTPVRHHGYEGGKPGVVNNNIINYMFLFY